MTSSRKYSVNFSIALEPQWSKCIPLIRLFFDRWTIYDGHLQSPREFHYSSPLLDPGNYQIGLEFFNKDDREQILYNRDMAVRIKNLKIENQSTDFSTHANYRPNYPEHWFRENLQRGILLDPIIKSNYLGWNGVWYLDIQLPIFRWIHRAKNLGWLI